MGRQSGKDHTFESSQGNMEGLVEGRIGQREGKEIGRWEGTKVVLTVDEPVRLM